MTIRSGGRPRDRRATNARPYDPDAYATETIPEYSEPTPRSRGGGNGGRGGNGLVGFLKFLGVPGDGVLTLVGRVPVLGDQERPPVERYRIHQWLCLGRCLVLTAGSPRGCRCPGTG